MYFIGWNMLHLQEIPKGEVVLSSLLQKQIISGFVVQARSCGTVNMVHQKRNVFLRIAAQTLALGNRITDKLVVLFNMRFLPRSHRVAVEMPVRYSSSSEYSKPSTCLNSLPLSVRITGNSLRNTSRPSPASR